MSVLRDYWNKNTAAHIPEDKGYSLYAVEKEAQFPRNAKVCDLGGGTGTDSIYFARKGHTSVVVDISDVGLAKAQELAKEESFTEQISTVQCDLSLGKIALGDESCDVVYSRLTLHYFDSQVLTRIFSEVYRILRPGGQTYLALKSPEDADEMAFLKATAIEEEDGLFNDRGRLKARFSVERLNEILADAGIPTGHFSAAPYTEKLDYSKDVIKSGNSAFIVNEVVIKK